MILSNNEQNITRYFPVDSYKGHIFKIPIWRHYR